MANPNKVAQGKKNKRVGQMFEMKTRRKFEEEGWIVSKWQNNINLQTDEITIAGRHFIPGIGLTAGKGFPDFVMFKQRDPYHYQLMFVECKTNNILTKEEKMKLQVLKSQGHKCFIAFLAGKEVKYREFLGYEDKTRPVAAESS